MKQKKVNKIEILREFYLYFPEIIKIFDDVFELCCIIYLAIWKIIMSHVSTKRNSMSMKVNGEKSSNHSIN